MILTIFAQKGGCGKTTTAFSLIELLSQESKVLAIDLDPQASLTNQLLGFDEDSPDESLHNKLMKDQTVYNCVVAGFELPTREAIFSNVMVAPSSPVSMLEAEIELGLSTGSLGDLVVKRLKNQLDKMVGEFDHVIIDCPGHVGLLTLGALYASTHAIACTQLSKLDRDSLIKTIESVERYQDQFGFKVNVVGVLVTRARLYLDVHMRSLDRLSRNSVIGSKLFTTVIPENIAISDAQEQNLGIQQNKWFAPASKAYRNFLVEIKNRIL